MPKPSKDQSNDRSNDRSNDQSGFMVCAERCDQCLFTKERIVDEKRMREVLKECERKDTYFVCHKGSLTGNDKLCCHGFYIRDPGASNLMRIAGRLGVVRFVPVPKVSL